MSEIKGRIWGPTIQIAPQGASGLFDAFGRMRVSQPHTLFDSKLLFDKNPLFWDEAITNASGNATSSHSTVNASVSMYVEPGDTIIRQTFTHWNYQPGKSTLIFMTTNLSTSGATGITARVGQFTATNGLFFEYSNGALYIVKRKNGVDTRTAQANWNIDRLDGTGVSKYNIDPSKAQILVIDYEWLGVGTVRYGFVVDGAIYYCHLEHHANNISSVYTSIPNNPLRYEIRSAAASGASATMQHICSTVIVEGGLPEGIRRTVSTAGTHIDANTVDTAYAMLGVRLKSTRLSTMVRFTDVSTIVETANGQYEWFLAYNPTIKVDVTPITWVDLSNSSCQYARGVTANTVTELSWSSIGFSGWGTTANPSSAISDESYYLGSTIAGTPQEAWLCVRPLTANEDIQGSLMFREYQ